jgi:hypothetical protein
VYLVEGDGTVSWRFLGDSYQQRPTSEELLRATQGM